MKQSILSLMVSQLIALVLNVSISECVEETKIQNILTYHCTQENTWVGQPYLLQEFNLLHAET